MGRVRNRRDAGNVGQVGYAQRFVFVRLRCGRDVNRVRVGAREIGAGGGVTILGGKARSLRRRAKRDEQDTAPAQPDNDTEAEPTDGGSSPADGATGQAGGGSSRADAASGLAHRGPAAGSAAVVPGDAAGQEPDAAGAEPEGASRARRVVLAAPGGGLPKRLYGRDALVKRLGGLLWAPDGRAHVLAGAGGTGKTAVARAVAREATRRGVPVWWVPAGDARTAAVSLLDLAADLGAQPAEVAQAGAGQRDAADVLWRYLEQRAPWLLVFDGADDPAALAGAGADAGWLRRTQGGLIVVTSRNGDGQAWGRHAELHPVEPLDPAAGASVLTELATGAGSAAEAAALAERLGGLPLALRHAGSLLAIGGETFGSYGRELGDREGVTGTRELALEALADGGRPQARAVLRVLCCLAPSALIPAGMLDADVLAKACDGGAGQAEKAYDGDAGLAEKPRDDAGLAKKTLRALARTGLIETQDAGVTVHQLVCETSRVYTGDAARAGGIAAGLLAAAAGRLDTRDPADWPDWVTLQPHVGAAFAYLGGVLGDDDLAVLAAVAAATALAFLHGGHSAAAAELAADALRHTKRLGAGHDAVLALRDAVAQGAGYQHALLLARQGRYEPAERELRELLAAQARTLGPDHPATLAARHDYALVLAQLGLHARAALELGDLLAARVRILGPEHRDTRVTRRWQALLARAGGPLRSG